MSASYSSEVLDNLFVQAILNDNFVQLEELTIPCADYKIQGRKAPLHFAATKDKPKAIEYLIQKGSNIEQKDEHGFTPLQVAVDHCSYNATIKLISLGADVSVTPLGEWALLPEIKHLLLGVMLARGNVPDSAMILSSSTGQMPAKPLSFERDEDNLLRQREMLKMNNQRNSGSSMPIQGGIATANRGGPDRFNPAAHASQPMPVVKEHTIKYIVPKNSKKKGETRSKAKKHKKSKRQESESDDSISSDELEVLEREKAKLQKELED